MNTILHINGKAVTLANVEKKSGAIRFDLNGHTYHFRSQRMHDGNFILEEGPTPGIWQRTSGSTWNSGKNVHTVQAGMAEARISEMLPGTSSSSSAVALSPLAPMPGLVRQVLVKKGQKVEHGQALVVLEAMKLQLTLSAGGDAVVDSVLVSEGQLVSEGAELVKLTAKK